MQHYICHTVCLSAKFFPFQGHSESCIAVDDFEAIENDQLSVTKGQRLEVSLFMH